ncbi:MAG: polyketide synthase [uncultured Cytophagales bacterium]|uniref:Polyketide synthase n=1 Tax=uncultured Cytophagales bacterium TaxID=158755 RepID=A0A6J4IQC0_9SPHI|nr:MAG: polyketide synthase [uncultured Cytophagales bacterium]
MESHQFYLKTNVQIEPLFNQWYAHPLLIAPATASMFLVNSHLNIMKSYVQMPSAHAAALQNPDMVGGPFIDYGGQRVGEIEDLVNQTQARCADLITLGNSIKKLFKLLGDKAKGYPLLELYKDIPAGINGFVELGYDLDNHPSFRVIERLLYKSPYYRRDLQSIALTEIHSDDRSFIFSTPRLKEEHIVHLPISFNDERIDFLSELKHNKKPYGEILEVLEVPKADEETFSSLLTTLPPAQPQTYAEENVRIRYFGHACVLLETKGTSVLTDPLMSYKYQTELQRFTYEDLPAVINYVVITHNHHDHIVFETLLQLRKRIGHIIVPRNNGAFHDPSMKLILENLGFRNVIELDDLETLEIENGSITAVPFFGEHCDLNIRSKSTYMIKLRGKSHLVCADSNSLSPEVYKNVRKMVGNVDKLFISLECKGSPMSWAYGALFPNQIDRKLDQLRRANGSDSRAALQMIDIFSVKHVFLYAMGLEPWLNYFMALQHGHTEDASSETDKLLEVCSRQQVDAEKLFAKRELVH